MCAMQTEATPASGSRAERLIAVLTGAFAPTLLKVRDDSERHAGHAGHHPAGQTHYAVLLVSPVFQGKSRVERARAVHDALEGEFAGGMHALSLTLRSPEEHSPGN